MTKIALRKLVTIQSGQSPSTLQLSGVGALPYVKVEDMNNCQKYQIESREYTNDASCSVPKGSIIFPKRGAAIMNNKVRIAARNLCMDTNMMAVIPNEKVLSEFLYYSIKHAQLFKIADTSTIPQINNKHVNPHIIVLPPITVQKIIIEILFTWDQAIEKTAWLIAAKEKLFSALIYSMICNQCDSWEHLRADKIFKSISDKGNAGAELLSVTQDRGVIPRAMLAGRVMSPKGSTDSYKLIKEGDFAISLRSFQGGIEYSRYQGLISPAYTVLRPNLKVHNDFYRHFFKSYLFIKKYLDIAVIGIRDGKQISIPDFMSVKIPYPPLKTQESIAEILNTARQEIDLLKKQLEAYRQQKRGLMQKLLTGQWRVKTIKEVT